MERSETVLEIMRLVPQVSSDTLLRILAELKGRDLLSPVGVEPFITLREAAQRLGVSPCSLWRWGVPGHELGGRRRFRLSEVEEYLLSDEFKQASKKLKAARAK